MDARVGNEFCPLGPRPLSCPAVPFSDGGLQLRALDCTWNSNANLLMSDRYFLVCIRDRWGSEFDFYAQSELAAPRSVLFDALVPWRASHGRFGSDVSRRV